MSRSSAIEAVHKEFVSATMASSICGVNPWESPYSLYQRIIGEAPPREQTFAMWLGTQMEGIVVRAFTRETKLKVRRPHKVFDPDFWFTTEEYGFPMGALLDGITVDSGGNAVVEAKTASAFMAAEWQEEPPLMYWFQLQHQLACTGWHRAYAAAIVGQTFHWMPVERDDAVIALITDKEREFWLEHVVKRVPPPVDGHRATREAIARQYPRSVPDMSIVIDDPEVERLVEVYRAGGEAIERLKEERDQTANNLRVLLAEAESAVVGPYKITCKEQTKRLLDTQRLKEEQPEIVEQYTKETKPTRVLRVTKSWPSLLSRRKTP